MDSKVIKEKIIECMSNMGIINYENDSNFKIEDYILDSIMFVSFIIELEQMFRIDIPDEYLITDRLQTFDDIYNMIELLTGEKSKE